MLDAVAAMNWLASIGEPWRREPLRLSFESGKWIRINDGEWRASKEVTIAGEGENRIWIKSTPEGPVERTERVLIDVTAPVIRFVSRPEIEQEAGVYTGTVGTEFSLEAADRLSGVATLEVAIDRKEFTTYTGPFRLPSGHHLVKSRATDKAGNRSSLMTGNTLSGRSTSEVQLDIR